MQLFQGKILLILTFLWRLCKCELEQCLAERKNDCKNESAKNKYTQEINTKNTKFLHFITEAKNNYTPCDNKKCGCYTSVINRDLLPFKDGITLDMIKSIRSKGTLYQIVNNKLYRDKECMFPARCAGIEYFLLKLVDKLPDMELVINTRDWPQISRYFPVFGPVFSFSKTHDYHDIMYPAWAFWEGGPAIGLYPKGIGRWDILRNELSKKANNTLWQEKESKAFFRGSRTSSERDALVLLSREHPEIVDAQYTKNQAWKSDADTLHAPPASEVSFTEHCNYKYLFNFRGVAASFRFKHILLCKSLVFHVGNEWLEFFYPSLKPWIHYVPVDTHATKSEIKDLIDFFNTNEELAEEIATNGFDIIWENLRMTDVFCYWRRLLKKYAKLIKYDITLNRDLVEVRK